VAQWPGTVPLVEEVMQKVRQHDKETCKRVIEP
jgi:hypothetical protein